MVIVRAKTLHEGIDLINAHAYGYGVAIFTRSGNVAREF